MNNVIVIGHTTFDTYYILKDANVNCDINHKNCKISFGFGDKIPVDEVQYGVGGGASNIAFGLSNLGVQTYLYTIIGRDIRGEYVYEELSKSKINLEFLVKDINLTNQAAILSFNGERTIFTYNVERTYDYKIEKHFNYIIVSSLGSNAKVLYRSISDIKYNKGFKIAFNPGSKELKNELESVKEFLSHTDILVCNLDEAKILTSKTTLTDIFSSLQTYKIEIIAITDGKNGAYLLTNNKITHILSLPVHVIEKTGAGDAFTSGFISALINNVDPKEALKWGVLNSSSLVSRIGAQKGLLNLTTMQEMLISKLEQIKMVDLL